MKLFRPTRFTQWEATEWALPRVYYGGGKSQQSSSQVSVPPEVLAQYQNVNSIANQVAQTPFQQYSTDPNAFVAPLTPTQQAGILGTNQYSNTAQPYYQKASNLNSPAGVQSYYNPEASQVGALMQQQFQQAQSGQLGNAINNGAFGGDRAAVTAANLQQQQGLAYGNAMAGIYNNAVQNSQSAAGLEGNLGSGAQAAGLSGAQAQLAAGQAQQQTEQGGETALYNQFLQQQSYPFQTTQFLGNLAEGTGALSGSTTTSNQPAPYFSDERLKDDIEPIGKTFDGLNIIKFKYKGDKQTHVGLSAQDVEKKHPHAVGLAGGYKTVDYDAATKGSADAGRKDSAGGLVLQSKAGRAHFAGGGLAPNSAAEAGFILDPSYLQAQEAAYGTAPWGNAGPVTGTSPYGGKSHVPPPIGGGHAQLAVAKAPSEQKSSGLQGLSQGVSQLEGLGKTGKSLFNDAKGYVSGLGGGQSSAPPQTSAAPKSAPVAPLPPSNDASAGSLASNDNAGLDFGDIGDDLGSMFSKRGGRIARDTGGETSYQDASQDDASPGGDVPYDSGTGSSGLNIPDDKPHNHLAVAQSSGLGGGDGGLGDALGTAGKIASTILPFFGLASGGRVGLAGGGDPGDIPIPALDDADSFNQQSNAPGLDIPAAQAAMRATADVPAAAPKARKSPPKVGLSPDLPTPDAQPVQAVQDMGSGQHLTQPGEVLTQDNPGGVGDFLNKNQGLLVPILHGLGTMASSNSRYLGSAILQGLGGAADSYENVQNEMQGRVGNQPIIQNRQIEATNNALTGLAQFNQMNGTNLGLQEYLSYLKTGKLPPQNAQNGGPGMTGSRQSLMGTPQNPNYSQYEKDHMVINGIPAYNDTGYMQGFNNHWQAIAGTSPYFHSMVEGGNHTIAANNNNGFTTDAAGNRVPVQGYESTALAQNHPAVLASQAADFQNKGVEFMKEYGRNMSLFDELGDVYHQFQAGPTADWRASVSRFANEFDPQGQYPFLHSIPAGNDAENYDKARKDIAQITAATLSGMPGGAPATETQLLGRFAADPHLSPGALRDIVVRGKSYLAQAADYYQSFDPFGNGSKGVPNYTMNFYKNQPFDKYRQQFDKTTPQFAGQPPANINNPGGGKGNQVAPIPSAAITRLKQNPQEAAQFDEIFGAGSARRALGQ